MDDDDGSNGSPARLIRARTTTVLGWLLASTLLVAASVFFVTDSRGHPLAWAFLSVALLVGAFFAGQLVPGAVVVVLDRDALRARMYWRRVEVPWEDIRLARVRRVAGDPVLALEVRESSPTGDAYRNRIVGVLLPVGADLGPLHDTLSRRLGRHSSLRPPGTVRPLR